MTSPPPDGLRGADVWRRASDCARRVAVDRFLAAWVVGWGLACLPANDVEAMSVSGEVSTPPAAAMSGSSDVVVKVRETVDRWMKRRVDIFVHMDSLRNGSPWEPSRFVDGAHRSELRAHTQALRADLASLGAAADEFLGSLADMASTQDGVVRQELERRVMNPARAIIVVEKHYVALELERLALVDELIELSGTKAPRWNTATGAFAFEGGAAMRYNGIVRRSDALGKQIDDVWHEMHVVFDEFVARIHSASAAIGP